MRAAHLTPDTIVHADEIAQLLGCSEQTVHELCQSGELRATKFGRGWVTTYGHVVLALQARIGAPAPTPDAAPAPAPDPAPAHASLARGAVRAVIVQPAAGTKRGRRPDLSGYGAAGTPA